MAEKILTATVAAVQIGRLVIEGLLLETEDYAVGVPQIVALFPYFRKLSDPQKHGAQELKRLMGKDFKTHKVKAFKQNKYALAVSLIDFERVLRKLDKASDPVAEQMADQMVGLTLVQLFSDAFGKKFEKEERQQWLKDRQSTKDSFWWLADDIKVWIETHGSSNPRFVYINAFKAMSVGLFGKEPQKIKKELGLTEDELNRDHFGNEALRRIDGIQRLAQAQILGGMKPAEAVKQAIALFNYSPIDYKD